MLVRFKSTATESVTMFGEVAVELIRMLGGSGAIPSAIAAGDLPEAAARLRQQLQQRIEPQAPLEDDQDPPVALATRAAPLLEILRRAANADAAVMWEQA